MDDSSDITSGEIATTAKELSSGTASPAAPASASSDPASADTTAQPEPTKTTEFGPVPWERHELILNKTRRELEGKLSGLSWAEQLKREDVEEALELRRLARTRPADLVKHLSARTTSAPTPDARDDKGEAFYSPQQAAALARYEVQQAIAELRNEFGERFAPIESDHAQSRQQAALVSDIQEASSLPGYNDYLDEMTAFVADCNARRKQGERIPVYTAEQVYNRVVPPKLAANREAILADGKKAWLAELNSTSERTKGEINPQRIPAGSRKPDSEKSFSELAAEEVARRRRA